MQVSVLNYKDLNFEFRIDAEYYRTEVLNKVKLLDKTKNDILKNLASFVMGPFGSTVTVDKYVEKSEYRYVRNKDISDFLIGTNEPAYIPEEVFSSLPQFHIHKEDLLITVVGTLGKVAIARENDTNAIFSCKSTVIRARRIDPYYLLTYLNTNTGQVFAVRGVRGAIQQGLNLSDLQYIKIFIPSDLFQRRIREVVSASFEMNDKAAILYANAEKILLSELGMSDWNPKHQMCFIRNFSDTQSADRIDAEYFQPMYEEVENILSNKDRQSLQSLCSIINYGTVPTSPYVEKGVPYIKGLNLVDGLIQGEFDKLENTQDLPKKFYTQENDIIISQMGTVGKAGLVLKEQENWLFASFTIRIRLSNYDFINPFILTLYINEVARKWYLMRNIAQASVRQNTDLPTIKNLLVPKIPRDVQDKITSLMKESFNLGNKSKLLLEIAKRGVEMAIEKTEEEAIRFINQEVKAYGIPA
jgi:restriction endonuclease S subunit